ncbi:unnamed protein product [Prorocentrum cordatum]|uniref:PH domain-containing protein n=1 Tax=Prorocentrum cordatum TaxID=2364126 RepID=A0ABN9XYV8_9DINO|nr:unnamed protein product [Polarella glacialis]
MTAVLPLILILIVITALFLIVTLASRVQLLIRMMVLLLMTAPLCLLAVARWTLFPIVELLRFPTEPLAMEVKFSLIAKTASSTSHFGLTPIGLERKFLVALGADPVAVAPAQEAFRAIRDGVRKAEMEDSDHE